eukprot:EC813219.1.p2 GENE.EC813219.1~~EC813219.1.p2  ORF type:complete len:114 (-),score=4.18 EC813219.1:52-393(-)
MRVGERARENQRCSDAPGRNSGSCAQLVEHSQLSTRRRVDASVQHAASASWLAACAWLRTTTFRAHPRDPVHVREAWLLEWRPSVTRAVSPLEASDKQELHGVTVDERKSAHL